MAYGKALVEIVGNLTDDIELSKTANGKTLAKFTLAVNHSKDEVSFVDCVSWEKTAEYLEKYSKRGQTLFVFGELKQNRWEAKDGSKRSRLEVIVRDSLILSKPEKADATPAEIDDEVDLSDIPF